MSQAFVYGLMMMGGLIVAIGAQNTFVLKQGLLRQHVLLVSFTCWLCDMLLSAAGVWGLAAFVARLPWLMPVLSLAGGLFLFAYGVFALQRAWRGGSQLALTQTQSAPAGSWRRVLAVTLALTLLNPHVYLDTVILVGSVAAPLPPTDKVAFYAGAVLMSGLWFFGLGFGARLLLPLFRRPATWRLLDTAIALMMFYLGFKLWAPLLAGLF